MKQKIFLVIGIVILSIFGISIFNEFMANHTYYNQMFASWANWKLLIWAIIALWIPLRYLLKTKKFSLKTFFVRMLPLGILVFSVAHTYIKEDIFWSQAFLMLCFNSVLLYALSIYFIVGTLGLGTWITDTFIKLKQNRWQEMLIKFWVWLGVLLLIVYILNMVRLFYPAITRLLFIGLGVMIRWRKTQLKEYRILVEDIFAEFNLENVKSNPRNRAGIILLGFSIMYYLYGFQLSFIPYSTARDANHAYMYEPKVLAENFWVLRNNVGPVTAAPFLRHMFIAFWFSLIDGIKSRFWLGPDTVAVAMNFLSGLFVMFFGIGTIKEIIEYFTKKTEEITTVAKNAFHLAFYSGWALLLLWLSSWMGAFLVFVDNKTDLGVMAMTILAILSGFIFLRYVRDTHHHEDLSHKEPLKYIVLSGFLFCLAIMAKPTSFIDVALFGILLVGLWINEIIALGVGIMTIGLMGVMKIANAPDLLGTWNGTSFMIVWLLVAALGVGLMFFKKNIPETSGWEDKKRYLRYIVIRLLTFVIALVALKWPNTLIRLINTDDVGIGSFVKWLMLSKNSTKYLVPSTEYKITDTKQLLAMTEDIQTLDAQNAIDTQTLQAWNATVSSCQAQTFTKEELEKNVRKAVAGNEDVGRYVGYGWKEFTKWWGLNLGYGFLRIIYPQDEKCYGLNHDAKLLCKNAQAIEAFDVQTLKWMLKEVDSDGKVYGLLSGALNAYTDKSQSWQLGTWALNVAEFRDQIMALRTYYTNHAVNTAYGKVSVPYRYIIPLNVVFNRSLQNLSSYYTDIGFIWLFVFLFLILALIYALCKRHNELSMLATTAIIWRGIWRVIGGGIVRYGMWLILRTILTVILFFKELYENNKDEKDNTMLYIVIFLFAGRSIVQIFMNFIRISSQGAWGPFLRYKMNIGKTVELDNTLQQKEVMKNGYRWKNVFDLQFPHYNKFIEATNDRADKDGVLIAGTYLQYFLKNQHNLRWDGMLSWFWEEASDGDLCKTYKRLQDSNLKYLVIDPNIWTVVMGEGNESLFNRFFAKKDPVTGKIQEDGAISMLVKLWKAGYINLFNSNNLGAKYAFSLSDSEISAGFGGDLSTDELVFTRAKLAIARFFPDAQELIGFIANEFIKRVADGQALWDVADVYGKIIDENKVIPIAQKWISWGSTPQDMQVEITNLTQDERFILAQYLGLFNIVKSWDQKQIQDTVNNILGQSLGGSSQLIIFELN